METTGSPGVIVFYLAEKGYGYVRLSDTREEFHFRAANVVGRLPRKDDRVRFVLRRGRQGYFADEVTVVGVV